MSEASADAPRTAGGMLREARLAQGLHIAALSASIKVAQRKLEALEADRLDELPDATFTRALAQTVCRALKIDAAPVLALLPAPAGHRLEQVSQGINEPFRDRPGRREPSDFSVLASPAVWGPVLLLIAAAVVYLLPQGWLAALQPAMPAASQPASGGTVSAVVPAATVVDTAAPVVDAAAAPAPAPAIEPAASAVDPAPAEPTAIPSDKPLVLRTTAPSWVEVHDASARVLLSRLVQPGESVALDGATPLRLTVGNASATEVVFRGRPLDLVPNTRDNVARLVLK